MQKYLLLLLMCLVGMIEAQAGIKVENVGTGSYILTFTNSADATYDWDNLRDEVLSATTVKIVTEGDYTLTEDDVAHILGAQDGDYPYNWFATSFKNLQALDMGDAQLVSDNYLKYMKAAKQSNLGLTNLTSFTFPRTTSKIPVEMFNENITIQEIIMLEGSLTEISKDAFKGCTNLSTVVIPNGTTKIGSGAFQKCVFENISFPNTLEEIGPNAFERCQNLKSITIPHSVKKIGNSAFQWNSSMTDVYVLGNYVEIEDGAFNQEETYNFKYEANGDVDYTDWKPTTQNAQAGTVHPLVLHIPNNDTAYENYVNPYLRLLNDPEMEALFDNIGDAYSNPSVKAKADALFAKYDIRNTEYNAFKRENWIVMESAEGKIKKFFKNGASGLFNQQYEVGNSKYGGWRNFMLVEGDVEKKTWKDGRLIESRWYSAVFPFDMSYNQVMTTYGAKTDVREFTYVNKHTVDGAEVRTVTFATIPDIPNNDKNKAGFVKKGMPYMIHPGVRSVPVTPQMKAASTSATTTVYRTIAGVDVNAANKVIDEEEPLTVTAHLVNGDAKTRSASIPVEEENAYSFNGTYKTKDIPANSFYLGYEPPRWPLAFYVSRVVMPNKWNPFTAIVRKTSASGNTNASKPMDLGFMEDWGEEGFGIATEIEAAPVVSTVSDDKVYNLNGQVVRENRNQSLAKGVYIVNGKKIVIR